MRIGQANFRNKRSTQIAVAVEMVKMRNGVSVEINQPKTSPLFIVFAFAAINVPFVVAFVATAVMHLLGMFN